MILLDNLSNNAFQQSFIQMPDGTTGQLNLYYRAAVSRWFFDFIHPQFPNGSLLGAGLCVHPNILRQFKNIINFGMACVTNSGVDPVSIDDFINGNASIYILNSSDVQSVETGYFGVLV
jgi:hypothetical protein